MKGTGGKKEGLAWHEPGPARRRLWGCQVRRDPSKRPRARHCGRRRLETHDVAADADPEENLAARRRHNGQEIDMKQPIREPDPVLPVTPCFLGCMNAATIQR